MYKIAICEDDALFAVHLSEEISKYFSNLKLSVQVETFLCAKDLLVQNAHFDLYFLDILLPDGNGLDIAAEIQKQFKACSIIFVSSNENAVFDAIRYSPIRFIRKTRLNEELPEACKAYLDMQVSNLTKNENTLLINQNSTIILLPVDSIYYLETKGHYVDFFCSGNTYHVRGNLKTYSNLCDSMEFGRSTHSFLIHFPYVASFSSTEVTLKSGERLPLSRSKKNEFQEKFMYYQRMKQYGYSL